MKGDNSVSKFIEYHFQTPTFFKSKTFAQSQQKSKSKLNKWTISSVVNYLGELAVVFQQILNIWLCISPSSQITNFFLHLLVDKYLK